MTRMEHWRLPASVAVCALAAACATVSPLPPPDADRAGRSEPAAAPVPFEPPAEVRDALLPPVAVARAAAGAPPEPRFDLSVNGMPAREFFMGLVEDTPYSMVVDPSVGGEVTLTMKNATIAEVMKAVRDAFGYEYSTASHGFHVVSQGLQSRVFHLDYLNVARTGSSQTRVSSGQVSEGSVSSEGGDDSSESSGDGSISGSQIQTRTEVDFWDELARSLEAIVGEADGRSVVVSSHTGAVVVRATPAELREVELFLALAQASVERQVILEAKILEVELSDGYQSGINWAELANSGDPDVLVGQTGGGASIDDGFSEIAGNTGILDPRVASLVEGTATSAFGGVFTLAIEGSRFVAFIELLETQGDVHTLSSPRVSTVNNQKAVIKVGSDEFFVTDVSSTTVTGAGAATTTPEITLTPFFSGIALDVTPQISAAGDIILHIHPSVSEVTEKTKEISVGGETQTLPLAFSTIRESDSIVRARTGQIVVIGGLMQNHEREDRAGVPLLGRIPYLGRLFRHDKTSFKKVELVILLRPTIVEDGTWSAQLRQTAVRLEALRPGSGKSLEEGFVAEEY